MLAKDQCWLSARTIWFFLLTSCCNVMTLSDKRKTLFLFFYFRNSWEFLQWTDDQQSASMLIMHHRLCSPLWPENNVKKWDKQSLNQWNEGSLLIWPGSFLADINLGLIRYMLHQENVQEIMDNFKFLVKDSKPNVVSDNVFHIQWSLISFEHKRSVLCVRRLLKPACFLQ